MVFVLFPILLQRYDAKIFYFVLSDCHGNGQDYFSLYLTDVDDDAQLLLTKGLAGEVMHFQRTQESTSFKI